MLIGKATRRRVRYYGYRARAGALRTLDRTRWRSGTSKPNLILFDPALQGYHGHHREFARLIKHELAQTFELRFYGNFWASTALIAELSLRPVCYDSIYPLPGDSNFESTNNHHTRALLDGLRNIDPRDLTPQTIFFMHTLTVYQLSGLARWMVELPVARRPKMLLQFQYPIELFVERAADRPVALAVARQAMDALSSTGKVIFATNSDLLQERLSAQLGQKWTLMPLPIIWPAHMKKIVPPPEPPVFGFFGGLRIEKGARILAEAAEIFGNKFPDTRFVVHAPQVECDQVAFETLSGLRNVELIRVNFKNKEDYFQQFYRSHVVLLPYDPDVYSVRTSGVLIEALGLGRRVITTDGTWMAHQLRKRPGAGLTMASYTAEALCDRLEAARNSILHGVCDMDFASDILTANSARAFCASIVAALEE